MAMSPEKLWMRPVRVVIMPQTATTKGSHREGLSFLTTQLEADTIVSTIF